MPALRPRTIWLLLAAVVAFVWLVVGIPAWHIQPFRPQSGDGMAWSYALRSRGPLLTALGVVAAAALVGLGWRSASRWRSSASAWSPCWPSSAVLPAWFARQNHFEWMFNPLPSATYARRPTPWISSPTPTS